MFDARRPAIQSGSDKAVIRPTVCPVCKGKVIDTLAKVFTEKTLWRCRTCEATWTIASLAASAPRPR